MLDRASMPGAEQVLPLLGVSMRGRSNQRETDCPICGSSDAGTVNVDKNLFYCFSCHSKAGDMLALYRQVTGARFEEAARELGCWIEDDGTRLNSEPRETDPAPRQRAPERAEDDRGLLDYIHALLRAARPIRGSVAEDHLRARNCAIPPADGALRFHPSLRHRENYCGPAMLAPITDALTGELIGVHRTWVAPDGSKPVQPARMALGRKQGGVIRLWPDEAVSTGLGIGEGIESVLSLAHVFTPAWSSIDAGNLASLPVLPGIETLTIAADHDEAGMRAAAQCADRWYAAGREVFILRATAAGADLNDVIRKDAS